MTELAHLVGHRFPGGEYRVAHWENWLLTDCTGREPMAGDLVHPIVLFHAPILGAGTSIAELFRLGRADAAPGAVKLLGYDWEYRQPLREDRDYRIEGEVVAVAPHTTPAGAVGDDVTFAFTLTLDDAVVAKVTNRWRFHRRGDRSSATANTVAVRPSTLPTWTVPAVDPARMKTMAAILRDPYPAHWDRAANEQLGLAGRVVNQGPLNLGYVANMLMAWAGDDAVRRLTVSFGARVLDGDHVVAGGHVREVRDGVASCDVWLARGDEAVVTGSAEVASPSSSLRSQGQQQ